MEGAAAAVEPGASAPERLAVPSLGRTTWVEVESLDWMEAQGSYARLHTGDGSLLIRKTLQSLVDELREAGFVRVHRSAAVRLDRVRAVETASHGDPVVRLRSGSRVKVSRTYRADLLRALGKRESEPSGSLHAGTC